MLSLHDMTLLNEGSDHVRPISLPRRSRPDDLVVVIYNYRTDEVTGYLDPGGLVMHDRGRVGGWRHADEAHSFAEQRGEFMGQSELRVEYR
jgi:hypothetical protein